MNIKSSTLLLSKKTVFFSIWDLGSGRGGYSKDKEVQIEQRYLKLAERWSVFLQLPYLLQYTAETNCKKLCAHTKFHTFLVRTRDHSTLYSNNGPAPCAQNPRYLIFFFLKCNILLFMTHCFTKFVVFFSICISEYIDHQAITGIISLLAL